MDSGYLHAVEYFKAIDGGAEYDEVIKYMLNGTSLEELVFDQCVDLNIRATARRVIQKSSRVLGVKPNAHNINRLWLKSIEGIVDPIYYDACKSFIDSDVCIQFIDEHCRAFRLFWHTTVFSNVVGEV